jgi:hypothetical protein
MSSDPITLEQVHNRFTYHPPTGNQAERYEQLRSEARRLALLIVELCPHSRERSLALTELQSCVMWSNASIALNENKDAP